MRNRGFSEQEIDGDEVSEENFPLPTLARRLVTGSEEMHDGLGLSSSVGWAGTSSLQQILQLPSCSDSMVLRTSIPTIVIKISDFVTLPAIQ